MLQDVRYALRSFRQRRGFTALAILTIALGIGPTTAILSLTNWLFLRPIPGVKDQGRLVQVQFRAPSPRGGIRFPSLTYQDHAVLTSNMRAFDGFAGFSQTSVSVATGGAAPRRLAGQFVMADYFRVLGVEPRAGRTFTADEDRNPGGTAVAMVSDRVVATLFPGDPAPIGRTLKINGEIFSVIGVAPAGFNGTQPGGEVDVWLPGASSAFVNHFAVPRERWSTRFYDFVARLAPGVTIDQANAELTAGTRAMGAARNDDWFATATPAIVAGLGVPVMARDRAHSLVRMLTGVGALLILITAANVANLLLFRGVVRRGEIAVRKALGASGARLVRQQVIDSVTLAVAGGTAGVLLAMLLTKLVGIVTIPGIGPLQSALDWRVLALTLGVSVGVGLVFGIVPATLMARGDLAQALHGATRGGTRQGARLRSMLTVVQLAVSLMLLIGALLFVTTLRNLHRVDPGFDPTNVTAMMIDLRSHGYSDAQALVYYRALLERVNALPGIEAVSVSERAPFYGASSMLSVHRPGEDRKDALQVPMNGVSGGYFRTLGIVFVRGRGFTDEEVNAPYAGPSSPVIISDALARRLFGAADPIGRSIVTPKNAMYDTREYRIIGVTRDLRWRSLETEPDLFVYQPLGFANFGVTSGIVMVRSARPSGQVAAALQAAASTVDPSVPLFRDRPLTAAIDQWLAERQLFSRVLILLALLGFALAAIGLHGLVAQTVAERTREFGIRMAVGADRRHIFRLVMRQAGGLAAMGIAAGLVLAAAGSKVVESRLFGVRGWDPAIYAGAAAALVAVVFIATLVPAGTATRIEPMNALRAE